MEETPPRRSRQKPPSGSSWLAFVPVFIGVIVLGLVIGAGLSVLGKHGSGDAIAVIATTSPQAEPSATASVTPVPSVAPTKIPAVPHKAKATLPPAPLPSVTDSPSPPASPEASASASPVPKPSGTSAPVTSAPVVTSAASEAPPPPPVVRLTHRPVTPAPVVAPTAPPASVATPSAAVSPAAVALTTAFDADGPFSRLAGNVVRQYLLSIARGDTDSAYAALGDGPGSHTGSLPEAGTLDATTHISKIEAHGSDSAATVDVDLTTANGPYYGQYTVHKSSTGAAIIVSHTFGKP